MSQTEPCATPEPAAGPVFKDNMLDKVIVLIMMVTATFVVLAVGAGAIMRYVFRRDIYGVEELITIAAFWMYFAGAIYATKYRQQIAAEMFSIFTQNPVALWTSVFLQRSITLLLCLIYTWWGWEFFWWSMNSGGKTNLWQIPIYVGQSSVFVGLIGMLAYFIRDLIMILKIKPSQYRQGMG